MASRSRCVRSRVPAQQLSSALCVRPISPCAVLARSFVFGLAVLVYQHGALDWLGVRAFASDQPGGLSWLLPASTIFLLTGLALDYDIFLCAHR